MARRMSAKQRAADLRSTRVVDGEQPSVIDLTRYEAEVSAAPSATARASAVRHYERVGIALVVIDVLCLAIALFVAHSIRFDGWPDRTYGFGILIACVLWVLVFHAQGLYAPHHLTGLEEFRRTVSAVAIGIVLVIVVAFWARTTIARGWVLLTLGIVLLLELTARRFVRRREQRMHASEELIIRTLIVGSWGGAARPLDGVDLRGSGYVPVGFVDLAGSDSVSNALESIALVERLRSVFRAHQPDCVLITTHTLGTQTMVAVMRAARQEAILVRIYTQLSGIWASRLTAQRVGKRGVTLAIKPAGLSGLQRVMKRAMDVVLAALGLVVASPILLVAAIAIKATSPGPVLFRQDRVTKGIRSFQMYKLRTMTDSSEPIVDERRLDTTVPFFKVKEDARLTRVGRFLRETSLDELPQLFNVFKGDMSLVGPRPLPTEQVAAHIELLGPRHEVRSGITGWWQIHGRSDVDPEEAIRMDHFYIENWSPALDLYVLVKTIGVLLTRRGAY